MSFDEVWNEINTLFYIISLSESNPTLSAIFCKPLIFRGLFCELAAARIHRLASRITSPLECAFVPLRQAALAARPAQTPQSWDHSHARGKNARERRTHGVIA